MKTQDKRSTELTHIRTARGINIHTANTGALSSATSAAAGVTLSKAATPAAMMISYASFPNLALLQVMFCHYLAPLSHLEPHQLGEPTI